MILAVFFSLCRFLCSLSSCLSWCVYMSVCLCARAWWPTFLLLAIIRYTWVSFSNQPPAAYKPRLNSPFSTRLFCQCMWWYRLRQLCSEVLFIVLPPLPQVQVLKFPVHQTSASTTQQCSHRVLWISMPASVWSVKPHSLPHSVLGPFANQPQRLNPSTFLDFLPMVQPDNALLSKETFPACCNILYF